MLEKGRRGSIRLRRPDLSRVDTNPATSGGDRSGPQTGDGKTEYVFSTFFDLVRVIDASLMIDRADLHHVQNVDYLQ